MCTSPYRFFSIVKTLEETCKGMLESVFLWLDGFVGLCALGVSVSCIASIVSGYDGKPRFFPVFSSVRVPLGTPFREDVSSRGTSSRPSGPIWVRIWVKPSKKHLELLLSAYFYGIELSLCGGDGRRRTPDLRIKSPLLYQLSYIPWGPAQKVQCRDLSWSKAGWKIDS